MKKAHLLNRATQMFLLCAILFSTSCSKTDGPSPVSNTNSNTNNSNGNNNNNNTNHTGGTTAIKFTNNAPTPINIYGYGGTAVIPVGGSMTFTGTAGTVFTASANTYATMVSSMLAGTST